MSFLLLCCAFVTATLGVFAQSPPRLGGTPVVGGGPFVPKLCALGDVDGDGVADLGVGDNLNADGGFNRGALVVRFMNADGTTKANQTISSTRGGFVGPLFNSSLFGTSCALVGLNLTGSGRPLVATTAAREVWLFELEQDGTVASGTEVRIADNTSGFPPGLVDGSDGFASSVAVLHGLGPAPVLAAAAQLDDDGGGGSSGAVYLIWLDLPRSTVVVHAQKISNTAGGLAEAGGNFLAGSRAGYAMASAGDLDGDGVDELAVGAWLDSTGGSYCGAVHVLFLHASNGTVRAVTKLASGLGGVPVLAIGDRFGTSIAVMRDSRDERYLLVGSPANSVVPDPGALWVLPLQSDGTVLAGAAMVLRPDDEPVMAGLGRLGWGVTVLGDLDPTDGYGGDLAVSAWDTVVVLSVVTVPPPLLRGGPLLSIGPSRPALCRLGDVDGDGVADLGVGDYLADGERGALHVRLMNANGTIKATRTVSSMQGGFIGPLAAGDRLGISCALVERNATGSGRPLVAVGASSDGTGGTERGAVWLFELEPDGSVAAGTELKIASGLNGFPGLQNFDFFGASITVQRGLDGTAPVLVVGASGDDDVLTASGAVYLIWLDLPAAPHVVRTQKISNLQGGLSEAGDTFVGSAGRALTSVGDLDGDGVPELAVGAYFDGSAGAQRGAVHILFLNAGNGTVRAATKLGSGLGGVPGLANEDWFGFALVGAGVSGGVAVGAPTRTDVNGPGALWVLPLLSDGTVKPGATVLLRPTDGAALGGLARLGNAVAVLGDLDPAHGFGWDLAVGSNGAVVVVSLNVSDTTTTGTTGTTGSTGSTGATGASPPPPLPSSLPSPSPNPSSDTGGNDDVTDSSGNASDEFPLVPVLAALGAVCGLLLLGAAVFAVLRSKKNSEETSSTASSASGREAELDEGNMGYGSVATVREDDGNAGYGSVATVREDGKSSDEDQTPLGPDYANVPRSQRKKRSTARRDSSDDDGQTPLGPDYANIPRSERKKRSKGRRDSSSGEDQTPLGPDYANIPRSERRKQRG